MVLLLCVCADLLPSGGQFSMIGGGMSNTVTGNYATILGGKGNKVESNYGTIVVRARVDCYLDPAMHLPLATSTTRTHTHTPARA
jgi:hypothetical protein